MPNMKSLSLTVHKSWPRLKLLDIMVKSHGHGHKVKTFGMMGKASSLEMHT